MKVEISSSHAQATGVRLSISLFGWTCIYRLNTGGQPTLLYNYAKVLKYRLLSHRETQNVKWNTFIRSFPLPGWRWGVVSAVQDTHWLPAVVDGYCWWASRGKLICKCTQRSDSHICCCFQLSSRPWASEIYTKLNTSKPNNVVL